MGSWILNLGLCLCLLAAAFLCLQSPAPWLRRIGVWLIFISLGTAAWFISGSWILVAASLACWFIIPLVQAIYLSRTLRFSGKASLLPGNLYTDGMEELQPLTAELRDLDFIMDQDYWLDPSPIRHGFRLFYHRSKPIYAAICIIKQGNLELLYLQFATDDSDGNSWITWDFPLSYNMQIPPEMKIYRCLEVQSTAELFEQHEAYLQLNEVRPSHTEQQSPDVSLFFNRLNNATLRYNLRIGMLRSYSQSSDQIGYSWRGTWYISRKVLWEMVAG